MHCIICDRLCTVEVYDGTRQLKEWACQPYIAGYTGSHENHYSAIEKEGKIVSQVIVIRPYKAVIKENNTTLFKLDGYYKIVCILEGALFLTGFNEEKFLEKMKTYVVF